MTTFTMENGWDDASEVELPTMIDRLISYKSYEFVYVDYEPWCVHHHCTLKVPMGRFKKGETMRKVVLTFPVETLNGMYDEQGRDMMKMKIWVVTEAASLKVGGGIQMELVFNQDGKVVMFIE